MSEVGVGQVHVDAGGVGQTKVEAGQCVKGIKMVVSEG